MEYQAVDGKPEKAKQQAKEHDVHEAEDDLSSEGTA
jgi:hypothetical protein